MDEMETIMKAVHFMENNQSEDALKLLETYIPTADDDKKYTVAEFYMQWGFFKQALDILQELLNKYPAETDLKILLANIYIELEDDKQAIDLLNDIDQEDPLYVQVLLLLADLYQAQGLFEVTELKLLEAKQIYPDEPIIDFALGEFFFSIGESKKSIIYYEKILLETEELADISINARLGEAYAAVGKYEIALKFFQKDNSKNPDTLFKFGFTAYHADRKDIAINVWKKVIELDEHYHTVYYELSKAYYEEELIQEAYDVAKQGLKMDEFNKELYYFTGKLAHQLHETEDSEKFLRQSIALDADYREAILFLIEQLKQQDRHEEVVTLIEEINRLGAIDPIYDWELARAHEVLENYQQAVKHYKNAYIHLHEDSEFLKEYGYFLTEDGKVKEAILVLNNYLKFEPSDVDTVEYIDRIKQSYDM